MKLIAGIISYIRVTNKLFFTLSFWGINDFAEQIYGVGYKQTNKNCTPYFYQ